MLQRFKSIPDWAWFVMAALLVVIFGYIANLSYPPNSNPNPLRIAIIIALFFAYVFPGFRLGRYVEKRTNGAWWSEYVGLAVLMSWVGVPYLVLKFIGEGGHQ